MALEILQMLCGRDNYAVLLHDLATNATAAIDTPDGDVIASELARRGWGLDVIYTTHHHGDHTAGHLALKNRFGCEIIAPKREFSTVPGADRGVGEGEALAFAGHPITVYDTPGHTRGHISFHFTSEGLLFAGDTLFALGCGRLLEDTPQAMWHSLKKLRALPPSTQVYCGHEYTESNARFALTIDPDNDALKSRAETIFARRQTAQATIPSTLAEELATNPFLRADNPLIASHLGMSDKTAEQVFTEIRARKDRF